MATLNIKSFPDELYERLQRRAKHERRSVAQEIIRILELSLGEADHSLLELRGLGKEHWAGSEAASRVAEERSSWDSGPRDS